MSGLSAEAYIKPVVTNSASQKPPQSPTAWGGGATKEEVSDSGDPHSPHIPLSKHSMYSYQNGLVGSCILFHLKKGFYAKIFGQLLFLQSVNIL